MKTYLIYTFVCAVGLASSHELVAQAADVSLPKQRDAVLDAAEKLLVGRDVQEKAGADTPNPFVWREVEPDVVETAPVKENPATNSAAGTEEFLARLAARIPATGIAFFGGEGVLLLGQKKLKVGDTTTISFEGQDYELSIVAISNASFTVKRGALLHTRPTQLASPTTRNIRP